MIYPPQGPHSVQLTCMSCLKAASMARQRALAPRMVPSAYLSPNSNTAG